MRMILVNMQLCIPINFMYFYLGMVRLDIYLQMYLDMSIHDLHAHMVARAIYTVLNYMP